MNSSHSSSRKPRLTVADLYEVVAGAFYDTGKLRPSHCDVRCACNDILDSYERDGYTVPHHYSQDKAHREVLRALRG